MKTLLFLAAGLMALALHAGTAQAASPSPDDPQAFTEYVAAKLRKELGPGVKVKGPLMIDLGAGAQGSLDRVYAFCRKNSDGCEDEVQAYVQGVADVARSQGAAPAREAVRLVVRPVAYLREAEKVNPEAARLSWPLAEGLVLMPVVDSPRSLRLLGVREAAAMKLSPEDVFRLGTANLQATLAPLMEQAKPATQGQIGQLAGDYYQSSRLALHDSWAPLVQAQGGKLIVAAPSRDALLFIGDDTPEAIEALRALAQKVRSRTPAPLTDALLRWTDKGWELVK